MNERAEPLAKAVPLPCFFDFVKSQKVAGQRPQQGMKSYRIGRNSIHPSVRPSARPLVGLTALYQRGLRASKRGLSANRRGLKAIRRGLRTYKRGLRAYQRGRRACQRAC